MFEDTEINDEFIREYLSNQLTYYSEPFVEKKARSEVQNDDIGQEFNELLGEITRDEQQIKVLIELCAFLLDKTQQESMKYDEETRAYEEHINQMQEKLDFEKNTAKQFQKMYQEQTHKINENIDVIAQLEQQVNDQENQLMIMTQSQRHRGSEIAKENMEFTQKNKAIDDLKAQSNKLKKDMQAMKEKVDYYQQQYAKQTELVEDSLNDNSVLKMEKIKLESKLKMLEQEINKLSHNNIELESMNFTVQEQVVQLRRQVFELQNASQVQYHSPMNQYNNNQDSLQSSLILKNPLTGELPDMSNRPSTYAFKMQSNIAPIQEEPEKNEESTLHSKQTSQVPQEYTVDIKKLQEKLERLQTPSQTPRDQQCKTPRAQLPKAVQDSTNVRTNKLMEKLRSSLVNPGSNLTSPRIDNQPITMRQDLNTLRQEINISTIKEEDQDYDVYMDGHLEQKILTPQTRQMTIKIPQLSLNTKSPQPPKTMYTDFSNINIEYFKEQKVDQVKINPPIMKSHRQSMMMGSQHKTMLIPKRDPYQEFFDLLTQCVILNSPNMDDIYAVDTSGYYQQLITSGIPHHEWAKWIEQRLYQDANIDEQ